MAGLLDWLNSGARNVPQGTASENFHAYANPDAILNNEVVQQLSGLLGPMAAAKGLLGAAGIMTHWHPPKTSFKTINPGDSLGPFVAGKDVANLGSIKASLEPGYTVEHGIQAVPLSEFYGGNRPNLNVGVVDDLAKTHALAEQIRQSKRMDPLIVVRDKEGSYVLEGGHRLDAAYLLNATHVPALVVKEAGMP